jgi:tRNA nucleotidyltransferase (CCA-adding enzyme)
MRDGTPLEDARRRDLTINSLFYNLHTKMVEDWTGYGLNDLDRKVARTPSNARACLLEDPLRVLRVVRISARYRLKITDDLQKAMRDEEILSTLDIRVAEERKSREYRLVLLGFTAVDGIKLLF